MISFIISSKFESPFSLKLIEILLKASNRCEVILVNRTASKLDSLNNLNIKVIEAGPGIGKNQCWNMGVDQATNKYICLLESDILFNPWPLIDAVEKLNISSIGIIGVDVAEYTSDKINKLNDTITFNVINDYVKGFDSMMLLPKSNYIKMPDDMKEYYGGNLLVQYSKNKLKKKIFTFRNLNIMAFNKADQQVPVKNDDKKPYQRELEKLISTIL